MIYPTAPRRHRLFTTLIHALAGLGIGLGATAALAVPIPFGTQRLDITAREQPIAAFLQDMFGSIGMPVSVSPSLKGAVNGHFSGPADKVYRNISRAFNLVEYYDGSVVHVYAPQDTVTKTLAVDSGSSLRVVRAVDELGLVDERNRLRTTTDGALVVSGTRRFIEQVEELAQAQAADAKSAKLPSGIKVFYLRYAWAQDVTMNLGGRQVLLPGVASTVRALMSGTPQSQVAPTSLEQPARSMVPPMRDPAGARQTTLGSADANPRQSSGPVLMTAYGSAGQVPAAATPPGTAAPAGNAMPARIEADARLNAVIVRDTQERMPQYEGLIAALDVEPQTIEIEATIIDVNVDKMRDLGINWRFTGGRSSVMFGKGDSSDLQLAQGTAVGQVMQMAQGGSMSAVLGNAGQFIARISALQEKGAAKVVSSPQVMTLSNVEAVFDNTQTFYVRVAGRDEANLFNVSVGTMLRVTPHVFRDNGQVRIKMLVSVEDGSLSSRIVDTLPVVDRSSINTQSMIFEGESLLVGGITRESTSEDITQVPGLGNIPVVGAFFRNKRTSGSRVERMFLITPRLATTHREHLAKTPDTPDPVHAPAPQAAPSSNSPVPVPPASLQSPKPFQVRDSRGSRGTYARGESYEVEVAVARDGYLYCYLFDKDKAVQQFFPNPGQPSAAVSAGSLLKFPGESSNFRLVASRSGGQEFVACINTDKDLGTPAVAANIPLRDDASIRAQLSRLAGANGRVELFSVKAP